MVYLQPDENRKLIKIHIKWASADAFECSVCVSSRLDIEATRLLLPLQLHSCIMCVIYSIPSDFKKRWRFVVTKHKRKENVKENKSIPVIMNKLKIVELSTDPYRIINSRFIQLRLYTTQHDARSIPCTIEWIVWLQLPYILHLNSTTTARKKL